MVHYFLSILVDSSAPKVQADEVPQGSKGNVKKPVECESYFFVIHHQVQIFMNVLVN